MDRSERTQTEGRRNLLAASVLLALVLVAGFLVTGCATAELKAPSPKITSSSYEIRVEVDLRSLTADNQVRKGLVAIRIPEAWEVVSMGYGGSWGGTPTHSQVISDWFASTWEARPVDADHNGPKPGYKWYAAMSAPHPFHLATSAFAVFTIDQNDWTGDAYLDVVTGWTDWSWDESVEFNTWPGGSNWEAGGGDPTSGESDGVILDQKVTVLPKLVVFPPLSPFSDVPTDHAFFTPIYYLYSQGIVSGYSDGTFGLYDPVRRAQLAKMVSLAFGIHDDAVTNQLDPTFSDVAYTGNPYPFDYVEEVVGEQAILGYSDGTFRPWNPLTRIALVRVLVRIGASRLATPPDGYDPGFVDVTGEDERFVAIAKYNGLINGTSATTFAPYATATRGHVAKVLYGLLSAP